MLFQPYSLGDIALQNRIVMAPMTRSRAAQPGDVPTALNAEHYAQRASAGLIVSEGVPVSELAQGYLWTPGLYSPAQIEGWKLVADAVHAKGGRIFAQIWHCGRISHASLRASGQAPVGPTTVAANAMCFAYDEQGQPGNVPCQTPTALDAAGIAQAVAEFGLATANAMQAGLDGVEIHGANGYLMDQFLNAGVNTRSDGYGSSVQGRARLLLEIVDAAIKATGAKRVGIRLSPFGAFNDMPADPDTETMVLYLAAELQARGVGYMHFNDQGGIPQLPRLLGKVKQIYKGSVIACGDMTRAKAEQYLADGLADLIAFGQLYVSNPDLVRRLRHNAPLAQPDASKFYGGGAEGYTDYPEWEG